jgi:hypothetical protein
LVKTTVYVLIAGVDIEASGGGSGGVDGAGILVKQRLCLKR